MCIRDRLQGQKIAMGLEPPAKDHWNITLDQVFTGILEESRQQREAKQAAQVQEGRSKAPEEPPKLKAEGSDKVLSTKTAPNRDQVLEVTSAFLECIHTLHLQTMHEMGGVREMDRTLARTLMTEFVRLQLIVGED